MIHRGFDVAVYCDGQQLPEFQLRMRNDRKTIDCYIPSEEGKVSVTNDSAMARISILANIHSTGI